MTFNKFNSLKSSLIGGAALFVLALPAYAQATVKTSKDLGSVLNQFASAANVEILFSPGASSRASTVFPDYGYIMAVLTLKPEDIPPMSAKVRKIAKDMASGTITDDEFSRAIKPMIERLESSYKRNSYWVSILSDAQTDVRGLSRHKTRESDLKDMKAEDVQALATDIFKGSKPAEIQILPSTDT